MIEITTIATGSSGNCYRITDGSSVLMIECGIRFREIRQAFDFKLSNVAGCLLTHEHGDHSKAVLELLKSGIDCYMSSGTAQALRLSCHRLHTVPALEQSRVGTFTVLPFPVQHDCANPYGFLIQSDAGDKLLFITDSFYCKYRFAGLTHIMIEANYQKSILDENIASGLVPKSIRNRIIKSHFEIENVKAFLGACDLSQCREIHLIHISGTNGDPAGFVEAIQSMTGIPTYANGAS